ncbi:MAG: VapC toxin family PIN domain ribonuclease [Acidobacteria bacterium]|nr:MAG: VapC toxin family PIN domain ribonuclease [Acidobacteriota bacterium]
MKDGYLLDTNIVIALFAGEGSVVNRFSKVNFAALSAIVYGELLQGALYSSRIAQNVSRLDVLRQSVPLLSCDEGTAAAYADIGVQLRRQGRPIPDNDVWIAATARQHSLTLVTRDRHFSHVSGIRTEKW